MNQSDKVVYPYGLETYAWASTGRLSNHMHFYKAQIRPRIKSYQIQYESVNQ